MADGIEYELSRVRLRDGWETTVYSHQDQPAPESRPVVTALVFG